MRLNGSASESLDPFQLAAFDSINFFQAISSLVNGLCNCPNESRRSLVIRSLRASFHSGEMTLLIIAVLTMMVSEFDARSFPRFFAVAERVARKTKCNKHKRINRFI